MRACSKDIKTKRIKTTNIIDTVSSKVQNKFTNEKSKKGTTHVLGAPAHARCLPTRVRGREARASATLLDLRRGCALITRGTRCAAGGRFSSTFRFSGFGSTTGLGEGTSQSGHAHSVWKISSSFTLSGVSSVVAPGSEGTRTSISICPVVPSIDNGGWRSTIDRNGGPSC